MELLMLYLKKSTRLFFSIVTCLIMALGVISCNSESDLDKEDLPIGTDDASLLAWQMKKSFQTRAATSYSAAIVVTSSFLELRGLVGDGDITIDWGDGTIETNSKYHVYTDGLPAHTIFIYNNDLKEIEMYFQEVIFIDVSRCPNLISLTSNYTSRITSIDLSKNIELENLYLMDNRLHSLDLSNNLKLKGIGINNNPISEIDVTALPLLQTFSASHTSITKIDLTKNKLLYQIDISGLPIKELDLSIYPLLQYFYCSGCPIDNLNYSNNPKLVQLDISKTNITNLDLSNQSKLLFSVICNDSKLSSIILNSEQLTRLNIKNNPIEQNMRQMMNLVLSLPDRNIPNLGDQIGGQIWTNTPYLSTIEPMLTEYNWAINPE